MTRALRIQYEGAVHHVTSRGNDGQKTFIRDDDRESFLSISRSVRNRYHWIIYAYCLMDNHYHLLIEIKRANLSESMRQLNGIYTQEFNRRHERRGHLFAHEKHGHKIARIAEHLGIHYSTVSHIIKEEMENTPHPKT